MFQTEFSFTLPKGYIDAEGNLHNTGKMRLSNAADEIMPMEDPRVQKNKAYLIIAILSRVIVSLGDLEEVTTDVIENIFSADLEFLQAFFLQINECGRISSVSNHNSCTCTIS